MTAEQYGSTLKRSWHAMNLPSLQSRRGDWIDFTEHQTPQTRMDWIIHCAKKHFICVDDRPDPLPYKNCHSAEGVEVFKGG